MKRVFAFLKKEIMLTVAVAAALLSFLIHTPDKTLLTSIDWKTLCILFMLLSVLDGFKHENLFAPFLKFAKKIRSASLLSYFLVFSVFISSAFVTNDVSLIIFVPLTIVLFRDGKKEKYIIPLLCLENIAAVRGSLLTPFGSPQNLFLFSKSEISALDFIMMMLPLFVFSAILLSMFILFTYRKNIKEELDFTETDDTDVWQKERKGKRILYLLLFVLVIGTVVSRTTFWPYITAFVTVMLLIFDRSVFKRVDYVLIITFLCFFIFSSSIAANETIAGFLREKVSGNEYWWSIGLSQIISNVPASIVLWPFTTNLRPLIYGLDTAGLVSVIGSLASVINLRLYVKEYPGRGMKFMLNFEKICLIFFAFAVVFQEILLRFF